MAEHPGKNQAKWRELQGGREECTVAPNLSNRTQQLGFAYSGILLRHAITPSDQKHLTVRAGLARDPVDKKATLADVEHDVTRLTRLRAPLWRRVRISGGITVVICHFTINRGTECL